MDKDIKNDILKIVGMIIILILLICGIVWMNSKEDVVEDNTDYLDDSAYITDDAQDSENDAEVVYEDTDAEE